MIAATAPAKTVELTKYNGAYPEASFDGTGSVGGTAPFPGGLHDIGINQETGQVFVGNANAGKVYKFSAAGVAEPFSALAPATTLTQTLNNFGDVFVDNSSAATKGRIYAFPENGPVRGYEPSGEAAANFPISVGGACGGDVAPDGSLWIAIWNGNRAIQYNGTTGAPTGAEFSTPRPCDLAIDSQGNIYTVEESGGTVRKYDSTGTLIGTVDSDNSGGEPELAIDLSNDNVYVDHRSFIDEYDSSGALITRFGDAEGSYPGLSSSRGIGVRASNHVVYAMNEVNGTPRVDTFAPTGPITIPNVTSNPATNVTATSATVNGVVNGDGIDTTECHFQYGTSTSYNHTATCEEGGVPTNVFSGGSGDHTVAANLTGLVKGATYHFRLVARNANNVDSNGADLTFTASDKPNVVDEFVNNLNSDSAQLNAEIDPAGGITKYHFEWGTEEGTYTTVVPIPDAQLASNGETETVSTHVPGLAPGVTYHYRVIAQNDAGTATGADRTFTTFAPPSGIDTCPNSHVRQQTGAALMFDCRAYELVSAADTGGYNVESDLVEGQTPFGGYPNAEGPSRALYGVHSGAIPGDWNPTNRGVDPYVATRGPEGWSTQYVGIPADDQETNGTFASPLIEADPSLEEFAFGGHDICSPCFADGSTNIPLRLPDGTLIKGMAGSSNPAAEPSGRIAKHFSADGSHFVFGSTAQFEPGANSNGTDATIYDRDLETDTTQVVSTLPNGSTIAAGTDVAELDISGDGLRIVIGVPVSTDSDGNHYYHLYMHVGGSPNSIDLTPGTASGALYDGMTGDGSKVFFTTTDPLTTSADQDTDTSADIFRADVGSSSATLTRVSIGTGGTGNTDSCDPPSDSADEHWNVVGSTADCSAVAIAGGGGVASEAGAIYFLSPEVLDSSDPQHLPVQDAPNLYVADPGQSPRFVATLESSVNGPVPPLMGHRFAGSFGSFSNATGTAVAPNGDIYVYDVGDEPGQVERYSPGGTLLSVIDNEGEGFSSYEAGLPNQIAVDPSNGDLYIPNFNYGSIERYSDSGTHLNSIYTGFSPTAVAVNPSNHDIYTGSNYVNDPTIHEYTPAGSYVRQFEALVHPRAIAVDEGGRVYESSVSQTNLYSPAGSLIRTVATSSAYGLAINPADNSVYVDQGNRILHFSPSGEPAGLVEAGDLTGGRGLALGPGHRLYVAESGSGGDVRYYDEGISADPRTDNPAVIHGVGDADNRHLNDFQATSDGRFAAFSSTLPLPGFTNRGHSEIYRYDASANELDCASCPPTNGAPGTDTVLSSNGLNLVNDGEVFFTTSEPLVLRDSNDRRDAYEWKIGDVQLISTGTSAFDSTLLGASADGTDVYFFTRDTLVPEDQNGTLTKIYDARAEGGFPYVPPPVPCRASDECHGAGSQAPDPATINTISGSSGNQIAAAPPCRHGQVRKHGKCAGHKHRTHHRRHREKRHRKGHGA
jgi:hypothetical protein